MYLAQKLMNNFNFVCYVLYQFIYQLLSILCLFITGANQSCVAENDTVWGISWQPTSVDTTAVQKCPGLSESAGKYSVYIMMQNFEDT